MLNLQPFWKNIFSLYEIILWTLIMLTHNGKVTAIIDKMKSSLILYFKTQKCICYIYILFENLFFNCEFIDVKIFLTIQSFISVNQCLADLDSPRTFIQCSAFVNTNQHISKNCILSIVYKWCICINVLTISFKWKVFCFKPQAWRLVTK